MLDENAIYSAHALVQARGRVLGAAWEEFSNRYPSANTKKLKDLSETLADSKKPVVALMLVNRTIMNALKYNDPALLRIFLLRYGTELKRSMYTPEIKATTFSVLAFASERALAAAPNASSEILKAVRKQVETLDRSTVSDADWVDAVGLSENQYETCIQTIAHCVGAGSERAERSESIAPKLFPLDSIKKLPPYWLAEDLPPASEPLIAATANWDLSEVDGTTAVDVSGAWNNFLAGKYIAARSCIGGLYRGVGKTWGPTSTANGLRFWHWIRLVFELSCLESGTASDRRRSATSAFELAYRCLSDADALLDNLLTESLSDFRASDPATKRARCAYTVRLTECAGHERALEIYDNSEKAQLRKAWAEQFKSIGIEPGNTAAMTQSLSSTLQEITQRLYVSARDESNSADALRAVARRASLFLDEAETILFAEATELICEATSRNEDGTYNHSDLLDQQSALSNMQRRIGRSHSLLLQDLLGPHVAKLHSRTEDAKERLGNISRPDVSVRLESARLPFSASPGTGYAIRLVASNSGNTAAERIHIELLNDDLDLSGVAAIEYLGVGSEDIVEVNVVSTGKTLPAATLSCNLRWSDAALQQFNAIIPLAAEDQRPAAWTNSDVNPFSLGTISDPSRLVGRDDDLASLEALIAGDGSAYITGHKRVGKTSLTRVLIEGRIRDRGWAGAVFSLGRALGPEQLAEDLVTTLMEEIYDAVREAYSEAAALLVEFEPDPKGNFARAANRWLRLVGRVIPRTGRVAIAVDDFDELPLHLVSGPQADGLFLFLRSLVDERWLNLIVVGSEVLPSVIQKQAHKLNQVVPVSVTNFSSRSATAALLTTPTEATLEWDSISVDQVHHVCRGNPYYETLLAHQIWDDLREQLRSFVTVGDVVHAAEKLARSASTTHFVHLWADSTSGIDHTSRRAIVTSAVLRAVARCGAGNEEPAHTDEVINVAQIWIQTATAVELHEIISSLLDREVLERGRAVGSVLISIPLVAIWLLHNGARELDREYTKSVHATETAKLVTDFDLVNISRNLVYRGEPISEIRIRDWLQQFGDNYSQYLAYKMLRRMVKDGYFTNKRMNESALPKLREFINQSPIARLIARDSNGYMQNGYLIEHGRAGDSTQGTISWLCKGMKIKKANVIAADELLPSKVRLRDPGAVLFILDDYCGSGDSLRNSVAQVIQRLPALGEDWRESVHLVVGAAVVSDLEKLPIFPDSGLNILPVAGLVLGSRFRPFKADSGVFDSEDERRDAEDLICSIGRVLLRNNPLGYGNEGLLALFDFNCPNNAPPIFWRRGTYGGKEWYPLFERAT